MDDVPGGISKITQKRTPYRHHLHHASCVLPVQLRYDVLYDVVSTAPSISTKLLLVGTVCRTSSGTTYYVVLVLQTSS